MLLIMILAMVALPFMASLSRMGLRTSTFATCLKSKSRSSFKREKEASGLKICHNYHNLVGNIGRTALRNGNLKCQPLIQSLARSLMSLATRTTRSGTISSSLSTSALCRWISWASVEGPRVSFWMFQIPNFNLEELTLSSSGQSMRTLSRSISSPLTPTISTLSGSSWSSTFSLLALLSLLPRSFSS